MSNLIGDLLGAALAIAMLLAFGLLLTAIAGTPFLLLWVASLRRRPPC